MTAWKCGTGKGICGSDAAVGADSGPEFGALGREGGVDSEWILVVELLHRTAFGQLGVDVDPALLLPGHDLRDHLADGALATSAPGTSACTSPGLRAARRQWPCRLNSRLSSTAFQAPTSISVTEASTEEMLERTSAVVERLYSRFTRGLGLDNLPVLRWRRRRLRTAEAASEVATGNDAWCTTDSDWCGAVGVTCAIELSPWRFSWCDH